VKNLLGILLAVQFCLTGWLIFENRQLAAKTAATDQLLKETLSAWADQINDVGNDAGPEMMIIAESPGKPERRVKVTDYIQEELFMAQVDIRVCDHKIAELQNKQESFESYAEANRYALERKVNEQPPRLPSDGPSDYVEKLRAKVRESEIDLRLNDLERKLRK
jgi:hypothetical protein